MLACVLDIAATRVHRCDVVARRWIVGTGGDAARVCLNRQIAKANRRRRLHRARDAPR